MPIVLRIFGGSFGDYFQSKSAVGRMLIRRLVLSSDVILLQTKRSIGQLRAQSAGRLEWFSTYVKSATAPAPARVARHHDCDATCRRFVFLGHLWRTKGLETMLEAAPHLPNDVSIDIYGPTDEYTPDEIHARGLGRVRYCGFLSHEQVEAKLWEYDCLVLPTYHPGEGYPGVIAEGFAHSLPVVTTRWLAIPEIVDASCGILVEPGDTEEFVGALLALNRDRAYWLALKDGARKKAVQFDHARWSRRFEEICEELVGS
jgi:glycosyltransferase involved in cell wall biosynthesis